MRVRGRPWRVHVRHKCLSVRYGLQQRKIDSRDQQSQTVDIRNNMRSRGGDCGDENPWHYCIGERTGEQTRGTSSCTGELVVLELMEHLSHTKMSDILQTGIRREQGRRDGGNGGGGWGEKVEKNFKCGVFSFMVPESWGKQVSVRKNISRFFLERVIGGGEEQPWSEVGERKKRIKMMKYMFEGVQILYIFRHKCKKKCVPRLEIGTRIYDKKKKI